MADSPWPTIAAERQALVSDLKTLRDDQWSTLTLCDQWSVRDLVAHMTATAKLTAGAFFGGMIGAGFKFDRFAAKGIERERGTSAADALTRFESIVSSTTHPPGPVDSWLGETVVHSEDIRRPLGITHDYPVAALVRVADFYKTSNLLIGAKKRVAGLTLTATDTSWTTGSGPEVRGPMLSIVMALTGRAAALDGLSGEGLTTLRGRM